MAQLRVSSRALHPAHSHRRWWATWLLAFLVLQGHVEAFCCRTPPAAHGASAQLTAGHYHGAMHEYPRCARPHKRRPLCCASSDGSVPPSDGGGDLCSRHRYSEAEIAALDRVIRERRDMRHFISGATLPPGTLERLVVAANHGPSVGFMQPWRFIRIRDPAIRQAIAALVDAERHATSEALPTRAAEFLRLKVEGIREAAEVVVVALMPDREPHVFGRRSMPDMDLASVSCAIQNMWLVARAEGVGLGWVSIFDPDQLAGLLHMPQSARPVAVLCLGPVPAFPPQPLLETSGWGERLPLSEVLFEDRWRDGAGGTKAFY